MNSVYKSQILTFRFLFVLGCIRFSLGKGDSNWGAGGPLGGWDDEVSNPIGNSWGKLEDSIPGVPGQSYPNYDKVPQTSFDCRKQKDPGYYGDQEAQCQVFHICQPGGRKSSFLCPIGTIFNQEAFVCDWWFNVNCGDTPIHFNRNGNLYRGPNIGIDGSQVGNTKGSSGNFLANQNPWSQNNRQDKGSEGSGFQNGRNQVRENHWQGGGNGNGQNQKGGNSNIGVFPMNRMGNLPNQGGGNNWPNSRDGNVPNQKGANTGPNHRTPNQGRQNSWPNSGGGNAPNQKGENDRLNQGGQNSWPSSRGRNVPNQKGENKLPNQVGRNNWPNNKRENRPNQKGESNQQNQRGRNNWPNNDRRNVPNQKGDGNWQNAGNHNVNNQRGGGLGSGKGGNQDNVRRRQNQPDGEKGRPPFQRGMGAGNLNQGRNDGFSQNNRDDNRNQKGQTNNNRQMENRRLKGSNRRTEVNRSFSGHSRSMEHQNFQSSPKSDTFLNQFERKPQFGDRNPTISENNAWHDSNLSDVGTFEGEVDSDIHWDDRLAGIQDGVENNENVRDDYDNHFLHIDRKSLYNDYDYEWNS